MHTSASFAVMMLAHSQIALAAPEGGTVTHGTASIQSVGTTTIIHQTTDRAIIGWESFDVNSAEHVQFQQPSAAAITVNRIRDTKASQIDGKITANGNIILLNPNGIIFGAGSSVDVGGIVATSADIADDNGFMAGGAVQLTKPGRDDARIINHGTMTVREAGLAGLVAPHVENHGIIQARMGRVQLASGDMATIDFAGDGLIQLEISDAVSAQSIRNTGTLDAEGGSVLITAAQARGVVDALITNTGTIKAQTNAAKTGIVHVEAARGKINNTGIIEAAGWRDGEAGGTITLLADQIILDGAGRLDVSGDLRGGTIRAGGDYQGGGTLPTSDMIFVGRDVILNSRARRLGPAGTIILWSDDQTTFYGHADASGDFGLIEISGKNALNFSGTVDLKSATGQNGTLLLDPTNITISAGVDANITGATPYVPSADNVTSVLNINTLHNALNNGNVIVQTRATGAQPGNITVDSAITWTNGNTLTLDAHNQIIINQAITGDQLHLIAGGDVALNAALSGAGSLTIEQRSDAITMGLGSGAGLLNLSIADLNQIQNGWGDIILGRQSATATMTANAVTWNDNLTLRSGTGIISIAGVQTVTAGNNVTIITDGNLTLANTANLLTGNSTGILRIQQASADAVVGLGGSAGTLNLTLTEINRMTGNWSNVFIGRTDGTGIVNMGAATWNDPLTVLSGTGVINVTGVQTMGSNSLTFKTDGDITLGPGGNLLYGSTTLTFEQLSASTGIGLGDGMAGTLNLDTAEIARLRNGWNSVIFGREDATADINLGTSVWNDHLTLLTGTGDINIGGVANTAGNNLTARTQGGDITFSTVLTKSGGVTTLASGAGIIHFAAGASLGTGSLSMTTDSNVNIGGDLSGTGSFSLAQASQNVSMGLGTNQPGTVHLGHDEIARILNGWNSLNFGRADGSADMNVETSLWNDHLFFLNGAGNININGVLSTMTNNLSIITNGGAITLASALNKTAGTTVLESGTGLISLTHGASLGVGSLRITTDSNVLIGDTISGTGSLTISQSSTNVSMGIGTGQAGTVHLDDDEIARIQDSWSSQNFGRTDSTAEFNFIGGTWTDPLNLRSGSGMLSINGGIVMGSNNLSIATDSNLHLGGALSISKDNTLTITTVDPGTSIGLGDGQAGTLHLSNAELAFLPTLSKGITIGHAAATGDINIGARSWADPMTFRTGTGVISFNGNQAMGANALTLSTSADIIFNGTLSGTSNLTFSPAINATSMGIGDGQAGTMSFSNDDLAKISNGWATITFGTTSLTGDINIGAYDWSNSVTFRSNTGAMNVWGNQNTGTKNLTFTTGANLAINGLLSGTGTLSITPAGSATHIGVGDGQGGVLLLSDTELNNIQTGWSSVVIGSTTISNTMNIAGRTWNNPMDFRTAAGALNINGAQNMGIHNLTLRTNTNLALNHILAGTGTLSILTSGTANTNSIGIGDGQTGQLHLSNTELGLFENQGWGTLSFGNSASAGALNVAAHTWYSNVVFRNTGSAGNLLNINGVQTLGNRNLTITSNNDIMIGHALNGAGTLSIGQTTATTGMGIGNGQAGSVALSNAELALIGAGWSEVQLGTATATTGTHAAINVGAYNWDNNVTIRSVTGAININGTQNSGTHNFTINTASSPAIGATAMLNGTGILRFIPGSVSTTMGIGSTGTFNLTAAEINNFGSGWSDIIFGREDGTGAINVASRTWNHDVTVQSNTGRITISGATMGSNDLTLSTNTDLVISTSGFLTGTGRLTIKNTSGTGGIGVGDSQSGILALSNAELARITDGWADVIIGSGTSFGDINIGARTWDDPMTFITGGNVIVNGIQSTTESGGTPLVFVTTGSAFINNIGSNAINPGAGRYLVYSLAQDNDTLNGLVRPTIVTDQSYSNYGPAAVSETGNVFLYSGLGMKILTLKINDLVKIYGDANPTYLYSYIGGLQSGDLLGDIILSYTMAASGSNALDDAGTTHTITGNFQLGGGYALNLLTGTLTVEKADLIVEGDSTARLYGVNNPALTISYSGFKNGENEAELDDLATVATTATILSDVGAYDIVTSDGSDNNYNYVYTNGTLTINKATLTATAQNTARVYGEDDPVFAFNYTGFKNGDTALHIDTKATGTTSALATSGIGNYAITGSGAFDNNYNFTYVNGTLGITRADLLATANAATRIYGDANPALSVTYSGFKNNETQAVLTSLATASTAADSNSGVGTYAITAAGAAASNYNLSYAPGVLSVTKANVTVTAGNGTRLYGEANPAFNVTYSGFKNGQNNLVLSTQATALSAATLTSPVGPHSTVASGAAAANYDFTYVDGILAVNKALLTATANNATRIYGDTNPAFTVSYTGFKNGEDESVINVKATGASAATGASNVGNHTITGSGASDDNYDFTYVNGTLGITKAMVHVTAQNQSRLYGAVNPGFGVTYSGFKNGESSNVLTTAATADTLANALSNVGTYAITPGNAAGQNYDFTYHDGILSVTKAMVTVTAGNATRVYGDVNPAINTIYSGFRNGQDHTALTTLATSTSAADITSHVGSYATSATGATANNYDFTYVDGVLNVTKALLTATAGNGSRLYGDTNPAFSVNYTGFKNSDTIADIDTLASASSTAHATSSVGAYGTVASGGIDNNYNFTYVDGILNITKAFLSATPANATRVAGEVNPVFTISYSGFRNGENSLVIDTPATAFTTANTATPIGQYDITASGALDDNYDFTYSNGVLDITAAPLPPPVSLNALPPAADFNGSIPPTNMVASQPYFEAFRRAPPTHIVIMKDDNAMQPNLFGYNALIAISATVHDYFNDTDAPDSF